MNLLESFPFKGVKTESNLILQKNTSLVQLT